MTNDLEDLISDGHGGFICIYRHRYEWSVIDIGAQRVDGNGNILWDSTGIVLTAAPGDQVFPKTCKTGDSTFITCWVDDRDHHNYHSDIYLQSLDLAGNILWDPDGIPAVHHPDDQGYLWYGHDIVEDTQGGAAVVWVDHRHHGYNKVLYADRFSPSGQSLWQINGIKLGDEHIDEAIGCQVFRESNNFIFRWKTSGFRVSYYNRFGFPIWNEVVTLDTMSASMDLIIMEPEGVFKYITHPHSGQFRFVGWKIDMLGNQYWPNGPLVTYSELERELILSDGYGGLIALWSHYGQVNITKIYEDGHVGGDTTTAILSTEYESLPRGIKLNQNYPNPFNSRTQIRLQLSSLDPVEIGLYDLLGRKVRNIFSGIAQAYDLDFTIDLSSDEYSSGIYFIVAQQGSERRIIKSTLLK